MHEDWQVWHRAVVEIAEDRERFVNTLPLWFPRIKANIRQEIREWRLIAESFDRSKVDQ